MFEQDPYPGAPKILFVGPGHSSHAHSWIGLLSHAEINVRLFLMPLENTPPPVPIKTYISVPSPGQPNDLHKYIHYPQSGVAQDLAVPSSEEWLASVVTEWKPDIIHTLGVFDSQGGLFYYETRRRFGLEGIGTWVLQLRGGSDIALRRFDPELSAVMRDMFNECDQIITDNYSNINYIAEVGFLGKVAWVAPVPGTGGIAIGQEAIEGTPPSKRERSILWPKAYVSTWSDPLPVVEAIRLAWDSIKPCTIHISATSPETASWLQALPEDARMSLQITSRIPREEMIALMRRSRVMLAPSLVDGVPNVLLEAMAYGAFPIVSPLDTITPVVSQGNNVLFARNLYPSEIAEALRRAMSDDRLVDAAAKRNRELVSMIAGRKDISKRVIEYYLDLVKPKKPEDSPLVTVVVPFHNAVPSADESVRSVLDQTHQHFEIILVNDGSTEPLDPLLTLTDPRVSILHQSHRGRANARKQGIRNARGEYIAFLDPGCVFMPTKLEHQLHWHQDNPDVCLSHTSYQYLDTDGTLLETVHSGRLSGSVHPCVLLGSPIATSTVMVKRDVVAAQVRFHGRLLDWWDGLFPSRIARGGRIIGIDLPLSRFRKGHPA